MPEDFSQAELGFTDDQFASVPAAETGNIPDGKYVCRIEDMSLARTKEVAATETTEGKSAKPMLKWTLVIVGGALDGRKLFRNNLWDSEMQKGFLKRDMKNIGVDYTVPGFSYTEWLLTGKADFLDVLVNVQVKNTKDQQGRDNQNVYINGVAEEGAMSDDSQAAPVDEPATVRKDNPFAGETPV